MLSPFPLPTYSTCALSRLSQASRTAALPGVVGFSAPGLHVLCAHTEVYKCNLALPQHPHWSEAWLALLSASQSRRELEWSGIGWHGELLQLSLKPKTCLQESYGFSRMKLSPTKTTTSFLATAWFPWRPVLSGCLAVVCTESVLLWS